MRELRARIVPATLAGSAKKRLDVPVGTSDVIPSTSTSGPLCMRMPVGIFHVMVLPLNVTV